MISFAQNHEDVVLNRAFSRVVRGTYLDVGAGHPTFDSVTRTFYDRGWRGINIEPRPHEFALLEEARTRDTNLNIGISDTPGEQPFYVIHATDVDEETGDGGGLSTFDQRIAEQHARRPEFTVEERLCAVKTVGQVCREQNLQELEFLKVDVEGWEHKVLAGMDWEYCRPRAIVVESTEPLSDVASHAGWERDLIDHGYQFQLFDGLNRFYVREEEDDLLRNALSIPANVLDQFTSYRIVQLKNELYQLEQLHQRTDPRSFEFGLWVARRLHRVKRLIGIAS